MENLLLIRYGEIYLKGLNRPYFLRALLARVREAVKPLGGQVWLKDARLFATGLYREKEFRPLDGADQPMLFLMEKLGMRAGRE